ncbi:MAG: acyl-CoA dehydrogenase family protein, partial [Syntrophomonadaceae bacterium]|nr:acyl-CoA dehydrogenase family protein [Syntrophomonadaceae bacterium]
TKAFCTEMLGRVTDRAIQVHGAMGISNDLQLNMAFRRARTLRIPDGTAEIQRRTIAKRLLKGDVNF